MRIQNNGLGVQSTTLFLMACEGIIEPIDYSIFADTGEEPEAVYEHLKWLQTIGPILVGGKNRLGDDLARGVHTTGQRFASIPAFTAPKERYPGWKEGMVQRQCTKEYKVDVIERIIRREILKLKPRQRMPKDVDITQVFGISWDERIRAENIRARFANKQRPIWWSKIDFPLIERRMTRQDCLDFLKDRVPHQTPRSACVFCPFKGPSEWLKTKQNQKDWERAVEIDEALRRPGVIANRNMDQELFLHRSCLPLTVIDFEAEVEKERERNRMPLFEFDDCEGMCGV